MGSHHHNPKCRCPRRPRTRICLRKGCGRMYQPRRSNQRYCQDPECLRLVRRWQAGKRQAKRRQDDAAKAKHAEAERARRQRATSSQASKPPEVAVARGHAAKIFPPTPMCNRPGCHEPVAKSGRNQPRYCCSACREAVRQVRDREHKWRIRGTFRGRRARAREYEAARARRCSKQSHTVSATSAPAAPL